MDTMITKITMQGFKSFNKRISIPLLSGFNIICGPNGSGKSNIVDAIAFVFGITSAKVLRADRLHELIFHGGDGKSAAEIAAVSLYLDNLKKIFPFEEPEVSVTRKVNRKGVSIYKIQGKTVTREKVLQLLSASRIHPDGHNIVLQGDVTQVIEMNPIERRGIIDEISGIAEYNDKKEKAQRDLDAVDQKLKEAEILITERYSIFKRLEEERNAALKYQQLQKQLQILKASLSHKKLVTFETEAKKLDENISKKETETERLREDIEKTEIEIDEKEKSIRGLADKVVAMSKRLNEEKEISELRAKLMITKDRIETKKMEIEHLTSLVERLEAMESKKVEITGEMPRAVREILNLSLNGVHGTVGSLIKVPEKYQVAVEVCAGHHLHDIVVENDEIAAQCIDFLKREKIGRATFIPLNKIKPMLFKDTQLLNKGGVIDVASKLIKFDTKFLSAMEFVFGNTLVVDTINNARKVGVGIARMVTFEGDLIERSGAMVGGHYAKHAKFTETKDEIGNYITKRRLLEDDIKILSEEVLKLETKLKKFEVSESTRQYVDLEKTRIDAESRLDHLRQKRKVEYEKRIALQTELNKLKIERAKLDSELENAKIEVEQYGEMEYVDEKISVLESHIKKTFNELSTIGPVNFKAIDEYEKFKEDFDTYKQKYEKILEEKKAVMDMMGQIEMRRKGVFYNCLKQISEHFNKIYNKMTMGSAALTLEDPNNLESGLMIQVNPPGKKLLNIDMLSGGEKSIVALAFLFAVQEYRPAPFYILDEVDAALDKENTRKISDLIKLLSKEAQFIVITHNDHTIKQGDRVYGCTMERGETKILGLELPSK